MYLKNVPKLSIRLPNIIIYNNSPCFIAFYLEIRIIFCIFVDFLSYNLAYVLACARFCCYSALTTYGGIRSGAKVIQWQKVRAEEK